MRNSKGEIVSKTYTKDRDGKPKGKRESFRELIVKLTNNGQDQLEVLMAISRGQAITPTLTLPDGTIQYGEPVVPNATVMAQASKDLIEMMHGKAVAQTEVMKAAAESRHVEQARALSNSELEGQLIEALAERGKITLPGDAKTVPAEEVYDDADD
jgi:predicted CopG family antitoxin